MAVPMTIHDAYALLNISEGDQLRPPLYDFYEKACEARENALIALQNNNSRQIEVIASDIEKNYQNLTVERPVFLSDTFKKVGSQFPNKIKDLTSALKAADGKPSKTLVDQKRKELTELCQSIRKVGGSHVASSTSSLLLQLFERMKNSSKGAQSAWRTIGLLDDVSAKLSGMEAGEVLAECGYATYCLSNYIESVRYFNRSIAKYNIARHQLAMVEWMLGLTHYELDNLDLGFVILRKSIERFEYLAEHDVLGPEKRKWYNERCKEMEQTLEQRIRKPDFATNGAAQVKSTDAQDAVSEKESAAKKSEAEAEERKAATPRKSGISLRMYGVAAAIPAGGLGALGFDTKRADGYLDVEQVLIEDIPHSISNLRSSGTRINLLADSQKYVVIKVTGDSMNNTGIEKGDYVLLRLQDIADDNDIVAVEIVDLIEDAGTHATLKRLVKRGGKIVLAPDSTDNEKYKEFTMADFNDGTAYIRGVAYAVFKPVNPRSKGVN